MSAFYNENEPYAVEWLKSLTFEGLIAPGLVDARSIADLGPKDLEGSTQAHFFAGIGGWSHALRLAGWPDDVPVWTGSCPCQPWSQAGRGKGKEDERHLWPVWFKLIEKCRPPVIFGEQVASPAGLGWLDLVFSDLEGAGYSVGAADLCAAGVGAPHIRQRLYFVAYAKHTRVRKRLHVLAGRSQLKSVDADRCGAARELGDAGRARGGRNAGAIFGAEEESSSERLEARGEPHESRAPGATRVVGNSGSEGSSLRPGSEERFGAVRFEGPSAPAPGATRGFWGGCEWILCRDGKARPIEPGSFPLAHGVPARVGKLRAFGNAIVPEVAATFIRAAMSWG